MSDESWLVHELMGLVSVLAYGLGREQAAADRAKRASRELSALVERLRAALIKHHELLSDEPGDRCHQCGLSWDGHERP